MLNTPRMRGFTVIEALVALALLLAGLAGAGIVLLQSVQHERESSNRRVALRLAASLADELRAAHLDDGSRLPPDEPPISSWIAATESALPAGSAARVVVGAAWPVTYEISIEWPVAGIGMQRIVLPVTT